MASKMLAMRRISRSVIFTPADRPSAMKKAVTSLNADVAVLDLEDTVSPMSKQVARKNVIDFLASGPFPRCSVVVRVNCPKTTEWGKDDIAALSQSHFDALILPKVEEESTIDMTNEILRQQDHKAGSPSLWCMIETAKGVQNVNFIANLKSVDTLVFGSNDLTKDLRARHTPDREPLLYSMSRCILAARASGKNIIDGVHLDISDEEGLITSCIQGRNLGFDGKSLIHPSQITSTNLYFSPLEHEIIHAYKVIEAYDLALKEGKAVCVVDNKLVEQLHVDQAKRLIAESEEISRLVSLRA